MEKQEFNLNSNEYLNAQEKFQNLGPLGVTSEDHSMIGSTPPDILEKNPGKTKGELFSEEEIVKQLKDWLEEIEEYSGEKYKDSSFAESIVSIRKEYLKSSVSYLRKINRLPPEFEGFDTTF